MSKKASMKQLWSDFEVLRDQGYDEIYSTDSVDFPADDASASAGDNAAADNAQTAESDAGEAAEAAAEEKILTPWNAAFAEFQKVMEQLNAQGTAPARLADLEDATDGVYEFTAWFQDYLDELGIAGDFGQIAKVTVYMSRTFDWSDGDELQLRFLGIMCLYETGMAEVAVEAAQKWMTEEPDNTLAKVAYIRACTKSGRPEEADKLLTACIPEGTDCTEDNELLFLAGIELMEVIGNRRRQRIMEQLYQEYLNSYDDEAEEDFDEDDDFDNDAEDEDGDAADKDEDED